MYDYAMHAKLDQIIKDQAEIKKRLEELEKNSHEPVPIIECVAEAVNHGNLILEGQEFEGTIRINSAQAKVKR